MKIKITGTDLQLNLNKNSIEIDGNDLSCSDSYHTFDELYAHRVMLFSALMKFNKDISWKSKYHYDGSNFDGWFIAGMNLPSGIITYHLPMNVWEQLSNIKELDNAPEWDGHTSDDVLKRINSWIFTL